MGSKEYQTWNPNLAFEVIHGGLSTDELRKRTLSFRLTDNARQFDEIEWVLDNADGYLTEPERVAAGLIVRVRVGYGNAQQPWRAFIINRLAGGVGVRGGADGGGGGIPGSPVGGTESRITFYGRNRNAPDIKRGRKGSRGKGAKRHTHYGGGGGGKATKLPWKRGRFKGGSTSSITNFDLVINEKEDVPRTFKVSQTSDAVYEMAQQAGYDEQFVDIEPTDDQIDTVVVQPTESYGQWLTRAARRLGFLYKADSRGFKFIRKRSSRQLKNPVWTFDYGADDEALSLTFDTDFRLQVPRKTRATGYDPDVRTVVRDQTEGDSAPIANAAELILSTAGYSRHGKANLTRVEDFLQAGGAKMLKPATVDRFIRRHLRAFKIKFTVTGNPKLMGGHLVALKGTGSFLDRQWYVGQVVHDFNGQTYQCVLALEPPPKTTTARGSDITGVVSDKGSRSGKTIGKHAEVKISNTKLWAAGRDSMKRFNERQAANARPGGKSQR